MKKFKKEEGMKTDELQIIWIGLFFIFITFLGFYLFIGRYILT